MKFPVRIVSLCLGLCLLFSGCGQQEESSSDVTTPVTTTSKPITTTTTPVTTTTTTTVTTTTTAPPQTTTTAPPSTAAAASSDSDIFSQLFWSTMSGPAWGFPLITTARPSVKVLTPAVWNCPPSFHIPGPMAPPVKPLLWPQATISSISRRISLKPTP